jgi:hypothetical protein
MVSEGHIETSNKNQLEIGDFNTGSEKTGFTQPPS